MPFTLHLLVELIHNSTNAKELKNQTSQCLQKRLSKLVLPLPEQYDRYTHRVVKIQTTNLWTRDPLNIVAPSYIVTLVLCHTVIVSHSYCVTLVLCHTYIVSHLYFVTLVLCHTHLVTHSYCVTLVLCHTPVF